MLRGADLTRLMVTLGVGAACSTRSANKLTSITGGLDGLQGIEVKPLFGLFAFDMFGKTAYIYASASVRAVLGRRAASCIRRSACRCAASARTPAACPRWARRSMRRLVDDLYASARLRRRRRRAADADHAIRLDRRAELLALGRALLILVLGGTGSLYGGYARRDRVHDWCSTCSSGLNPQYWQFWLGLLLIFVVLFARERHHRRAARRLAGGAAGAQRGRA